MFLKDLITLMFGSKDERTRMWCINKCRDPFGDVDLKKAQTIYDFVTSGKPMVTKK